MSCIISTKWDGESKDHEMTSFSEVPPADLKPDFVIAPLFLHPAETGGKRAGHNLQKNDTPIGQDKNWLEPTRPKMVEYLTSSGAWASYMLMVIH